VASEDLDAQRAAAFEDDQPASKLTTFLAGMSTARDP